MNQQEFQQDLDSLGDHFSLVDASKKEEAAGCSVDDWGRFFGEVKPSQLVCAFTNAASGKPIALEVQFLDNDGERSCQVSLKHDAKLGMVSGRENVIHIRFYHEASPKLTGVYLADQEQGKGLAKKYLAAIAQIVKETGAPSLELTAQEVGSFAWVKYGFTPYDRCEWELLQKQIEDRLDREQRTLEFDDKKYDVHVEMPVIEAVLASDYDQMPETLAELTQLRRVLGEYNEQPLTVGKALLLDGYWHGSLSLDEQSPCYQRFKQYAEGKTNQVEIG